MIKLITFIISIYSASIFAGETCKEINEKAELSQTHVDSDESGYVISGNGREYFYDAPSEQCINKKIFLIKGDLVNIYAEYNNFSYAMYFKKNGETVEGWIKSNNLLPTGTGIGPKE